MARGNFEDLVLFPFAMARGHFIVLEGVDGSGTTSQTQTLVTTLRGRGLNARATREPSDGPVGVLIRQILTGRVVVPGGRAPAWDTMALLFAGDRLDHVESEIEPFVDEGGIVVSDRYVASSLAYQSVTSGGAASLDWIRSLNARARKPDLTIVLDVSAETAASRRTSRGDAAQLYEQNEVQRALCAFYKELPARMSGEPVMLVNGEGPREEVAARVLNGVENVIR